MRRPSTQTAALLVTALAFFVDTLLYDLLVPLLPRYARAMDLNPLQVGLLFGSYAVTLLLATFPVALATDRWGRRTPMLWGLGGLAATTLAFAFSRSYPVLVVARSLQGVSGAATWLPGMALLADHFPSESRGRAMGTAFAAANLGLILGPSLSGFLDQRVGPAAPFLLGAALVALDALGRLFLLPADPPPAEPRLPFARLLRDRGVRVFAGAMALGSGLWALLEASLPLDLDRRLGLGSAAIGTCFALAAVAHTLASPLMGRLSDRIGRAPVLRIGLVLALVLLPLPALLPRPWLVALALMGLGATASFIMSPCSPALADRVEALGSHSYGSGFSILNLGYSVGMMLGPLVGGALVQALGLRPALALAGLGYAGYLLVVRGIRA